MAALGCHEHTMKNWILALFGLSLSGCFGSCGPSPEGRDLSEDVSCTDDAAPAAPTIVLGTAEDGEFVALEGGEELALDYGAQGGQHFYFSGRFFGAGPTDFVLVRFTGDAATNEGNNQTFLDAQCSADQWVEAQNYRVFMSSAEGGSGTLTVELGHCTGAGDACDYPAGSDLPSNFEAVASAEVAVTILP